MSSQPNYRGYRFPPEIIIHLIGLVSTKRSLVEYTPGRRGCPARRLTRAFLTAGRQKPEH